ncbi:uncharacterized protein LOC111068711 [Drosophila obscura]|uniref:uncharacterized protein LOC111068711 n=1 Tax=Drosophila obscura TaxID=7282 RepID=UPI001BB17B20|nr:uncharacterized protein LOC111068711 [Drosophila obscura]
MFSSQRICPLEQSLKLCCLMGLLVVVLSLLSPADARYTRRPRRTTTARTPRPTTQVPDRLHHWPPLVAPPQTPPVPPAQIPHQTGTTEAMPRLVDSFDQRSVDGQYEFRYQLDNGNTRYERAYWLPVGKDLVLARKGYYSFPLPNQQFSTVFYRADHLGYHVDLNTLSGKQPLLPRNLEVPQAGAPGAATAKLNSISMPERNEQQEQKQEQQEQGQQLGLPATGVRADSGKDEVQSPTELAPNALNQVETETETEPSTVANDILATEAAVDSHEADDDDDDNADDDQEFEVVGGDSN